MSKIVTNWISLNTAVATLCHRVSFHPLVSSKRQKIMKESLSHKTATCTHDIISYTPTVNSVIKHDVFACTLLHCGLHMMCQYIAITIHFDVYFAIIQLLCMLTLILPSTYKSTMPGRQGQINLYNYVNYIRYKKQTN